MTRIDDVYSFNLGKDVPADLKKRTPEIKFGKKISIKEAAKVTGGNALQNFVARLKLLIEKKVWLRDKKITQRVDTHEQNELMELHAAFQRAFPNPDQIKDKRLVKFMDRFVEPRITPRAFNDFAGGLDEDPNFYLINLKPPQTVRKNILRLLEAGITAKDLVEKNQKQPQPREINDLLSDLADSDNIDGILADFDLTPEFYTKLEAFSDDPAVQAAFARVMPEKERAKLDQLLDIGVNASEIAEKLLGKQGLTPKEITVVVSNYLKYEQGDITKENYNNSLVDFKKL